MNVWVFDATLGSYSSEQRGGLCETAKAVSLCHRVGACVFLYVFIAPVLDFY